MTFEYGNPQYIWHDDVHRQWAKETLYYFRLGFGPTYNRPRILRNLEAILDTTAISSYRRYEIYGSTDILLRAWLPSGQEPGRFCQSLHTQLSSCHCKVVDPVSITETLYHWLWKDSKQPARIIHPALPEFPDVTLIDSINSVPLNRERAKEAISADLVREYRPTDGILLFVLIPRMSHFDTATLFSQHLVERFAKSKLVRQLAIYRATGTYDLLVKARVQFQKYERIASDFVDVLNQRALEHGVKTETLLAAGGGKESYTQVEKLNLRTALKSYDFASRDQNFYFSCDESDTLEFKGSLATNLDRLFLGDGKLEASNEYAINEGAIKAVAALLNTFGGEVVIGLLEKDRYKSIADKLVTFPQSSKYLAVGIEIEKDYKNWDKLQLRLTDLITKHIKGKKKAMSWIQIRPLSIENKTLAIISVQPPPPDTLFFLNGEVFIRESNRTISVAPENLDDYKETRKLRYLRGP